ncbi:MAG: hypothetical protein ACK42D_01775 [Candidatus Paceibacteria bacterium]
MTIFLRTTMQRLALKLPSILCMLVISLAFFFIIFDSVNAQIGRPGDDVIPVPNVPDPYNPPNPIDRPILPTPGPDTNPGNPGPIPGPGDDNGGGGGGGGTGNTTPTPETPIIIGDGFLDSLYGFIIIFGGQIVGWMGKLLNWAVSEFVVGFGDVYLTWGVGVAVENGWKMIRDVLNITFIFAIVYIGIRLIFDADDSSAKRSLGYLLAAALLINFSLFISKFVVDFSNSLAAVIYNTGLKTASADLGAAFINLLGLSSVVSNGNTLTVGSSVSGGLAIIFGTFIFMLLATYALAAGAFLLFVRGIALIFFMIFSPVMFLGWIFPQFRSFTSKYWSMFLSNAFMAPAYMFCIYLTFMIMSGFKYRFSTEGGGHIGNLFAGEAYAANINALVVFTLAIGMMLASISIAKRMGAFGGGLVVSVGNSMRKSGQGILYRNTGGRLAKGGMNVMDKAGISNIPGARALRSSLNSAYNYGAQGTSLAKTRSDIESHKADVTKNRSRMTSAASTASANADIARGLSGSLPLNGLREKEASGVALNSSELSQKNELEKAEAKMESAVAGLSISQLENMSAKERNNIAHLLTASQREKIDKSEKIGDGEKSKITTNRVNKIKEKIGDTAETLKPSAVTSLSTDEIETLGSDWMLENGHILSKSQFDKIVGKDSKEFSVNQKSSFIAARKNTLDKIAKSTTVTQADIDKVFEGIKNKPKEIVELPVELLKRDEALRYISDLVLRELSGKIGDNDKQFIENNILQGTAIKHADAPAYFNTGHARNNW